MCHEKGMGDWYWRVTPLTGNGSSSVAVVFAGIDHPHSITLGAPIAHVATDGSVELQSHTGMSYTGGRAIITRVIHAGATT